MSDGAVARRPERVVISGEGAVTAAGVGADALAQRLLASHPAIAAYRAEGVPDGLLAARLPPFDVPASLTAFGGSASLTARARRAVHRAPWGVQAALLAAVEAWTAAGVERRALDPRRCALVVSGHNVSQQLTWEMARSYGDRLTSVPPSYALRFLDSDVLSSVSEALDIRGEGMVAGGASASGSVAVIQGMRLVRAGLADVCLVVGAPCDLSPLELHALDALGVLMKSTAPGPPVYRPFDQRREGFVYGQGAAALVLERSHLDAPGPGPGPLAIVGGSIALDASRLPTPTLDGEVASMQGALRDAGLRPDQIDYLNAHATGSIAGDEAELQAIEQVFGQRACDVWINTSKALIGHCLTSAGVVELVACVLQMRRGFLHGNPHLEIPLRATWRLLAAEARHVEARRALKNGFGFGGINTSIVIEKGP